MSRLHWTRRFIVTGSFVVAMCTFAGEEAQTRAEPIKAVVSQRGGWDASVVELGIRAGIFRNEGLDVELLYASGGGEPLQALISGSVDISVSTGFIATLGMLSKGAPLEIVSASFTGTSDSFWYVPASSPIKSLSDTPGKTVAFTGFGSSSQLVLLNLLEQYGITGAKPVAGGNPTAIQTAVMSGQIDVGFSIAPMNLLAVDEGKVRIIARGNEVRAMKDQTTRVNVVSTRALAEKGDAIRRIHEGAEQESGLHVWRRQGAPMVRRNSWAERGADAAIARCLSPAHSHADRSSEDVRAYDCAGKAIQIRVRELYCRTGDVTDTDHGRELSGGPARPGMRGTELLCTLLPRYSRVVQRLLIHSDLRFASGAWRGK